MSEQAAENDVIDARHLWLEDPCECCECCDGYCPDQERPAKDRWDTLFSVLVGDVEYVGDRRTMIRRDRIKGLPDDVTILTASGQMKAEWAIVPERVPEPFTGYNSAKLLDRLDLAGIQRHKGPENIVNLYFGGDHVGWCMSAKPGFGILADELEEVRRLAIEVRLNMDLATKAFRFFKPIDLSNSPGQADPQ